MTGAPVYAAPHAWNTTQFKVEFMPDADENGTECNASILGILGFNSDWADVKARSLGYSDLSAVHAYLATIEEYLEDIGRQFQAAGFLEPRMLGVKNGKYNVFFRTIYKNCASKEPSVNRASVTNPFKCDNRDSKMVINASVWSPTGRQQRAAYLKQWPNSADAKVYDNKSLYLTLTHELFHAIQGTYDTQFHSIQPCGSNDWGIGPEGIVVEGMAEAVAIFLTARKWPDFLKTSTGRTVLGGYSYKFNIFNPPKGSGYMTNSFWRYIADRQTSLEFLDILLRNPVGSKRPAESDRVRWLDWGLESNKVAGESLYTLLPSALTEIASYGRSRYPVTQRKWLKWFSTSGCEQADITDGAKPFFVTLAPYSAKCFVISWGKSNQPRAMHFEAISTSEQLVDQLHLGLVEYTTEGSSEDCWEWVRSSGKSVRKNTCVFEKVKVSSGPHPDTYARWWLPDVDIAKHFKKNSGSYLLILSNIAPQTDSSTGKIRETYQVNALTFRVGFAETRSADGRQLPPPQGRNMLGMGTLGALIRETKPENAGAVHSLAAAGDVKPARDFEVDTSAVKLWPAVYETGAMHAGATTGSGGPHRVQVQTDIRQQIYGIQPGMPGNIDHPDFPNLFSFIIGEPGETMYQVSPLLGQRYEPGNTGPFRGTVLLGAEPENLLQNYNSSGTLSMGPGSQYCKGGPGWVAVQGDKTTGGLIGSIKRSDELELRIHVQTDLCRVDFIMGSDTEPSPVVVGHVDFEMILPFGWRYFASTAPTDIVTPGVAVYMDRYFDEIRDASGTQTIVNEMLDSVSGASVGGSTRIPQDCTCSCEEFQQSKTSGKNEHCAVPCLAQYLQCQMTAKAVATEVFNYQGQIAIRALMALRKSHQDKGIKNQILNERDNTITVTFSPNQIDKAGVTKFLQDLGVNLAGG